MTALSGVVAGLQEVVLWTHDMERSLHFYRDLFGLPVISPPEFKSKFVQAGEVGGVPQVIVLVPHPDPASRFPREKAQRVMHHLALVVDPDRYDEQLQRCRDDGLEVRDGQHPFLKVKSFYVDDPEGNEVEVVCRVR